MKKQKSQRSKRQEGIVNKWRDVGGRGTLLAATGFGKTWTAIMAAKRMKEKDHNCRIVVVVPTINLKQQWQQELKKAKLTRNSQVFVINTAYKQLIGCDLLILDEIHEFGGDKFSSIFDNIDYKFILGLSATVEEDSKIYPLIKKHCPVFEEVTLEECLENGWISQFVVYNLAVPLTQQEQFKYNQTQFLYSQNEKFFGGPITAFSRAKWALENGDKISKHKAMVFWKAMGRRRKILYNAVNKIEVTSSIIKECYRKTLVFSQSIPFADKIYRRLIGICVAYHSKMIKSDREFSLRRFLGNNPTYRVMVACEAVDSGLDDDNISLIIITSGNSKTRYDKQRIGRGLRAKDGKKTIVVNLYIEDSQEVVWLNRRQKGYIPKWISSISEIDELKDS